MYEPMLAEDTKELAAGILQSTEIRKGVLTIKQLKWREDVAITKRVREKSQHNTESESIRGKQVTNFIKWSRYNERSDWPRVTFRNHDKARELHHNMTLNDFTISKMRDFPKFLLQFEFLK